MQTQTQRVLEDVAKTFRHSPKVNQRELVDLRDELRGIAIKSAGPDVAFAKYLMTWQTVNRTVVNWDAGWPPQFRGQIVLSECARTRPAKMRRGTQQSHARWVVWARGFLHMSAVDGEFPTWIAAT